jgi:hypothetical protein
MDDSTVSSMGVILSGVAASRREAAAESKDPYLLNALGKHVLIVTNASNTCAGRGER